MNVPQPLDFLDAISGHLQRERTSSADRPIRLATVDPAYNPFAAPGYPNVVPPARVTFDGEDTLSGKAHPVAQGVIPRAGQRVFMLPQGSGYLLAGGVNPQTPQGFWADSTADFGVELGGGSYFDAAEGLYLETDATIQGILQVGPRGLRAPEIQVGSVTFTGTGAGSYAQAVTFPVAWPAGTVVLPFANVNTGSGPSAWVMARAYGASPTGLTVYIATTDAATKPTVDASGGIPVTWLALAYPTS